MTWHVPPAEQSVIATEEGLGAANCRGSAIVSRRTDGVFPFLRFFLRMSVSLTVSIASTAGVMMWYGLRLRRMRCVCLRWNSIAGIIYRDKIEIINL